MAESKGFFRRTAVRLRIASLFNHGLSNSPPDCFHRQIRPSLFESLAVLSTKNKGYSKCYTLHFWRRARDSAHFVRRKVCYANYPDYRLLLTRLRLAKDCKGSNSINNLQKNNGTVFITPYRYSWRRARDFFGVLPYAFASLRSLTTDFQTVHRTVFIGKADRPCSNPLLKITQRKTRHSKRYTLFSWRRARDSNPRNRFGGLHDFQSCSFDQLGQLSVLPEILYTIV